MPLTTTCHISHIVLRVPRLADFARQARDVVERDLTTPSELHYRESGKLVPPVDRRFQLDRVLLRADTVPPEIHILFRWADEPALFGIREEVQQDDDEEHGLGAATPDEFASLITNSLEENLLAWRFGIENAIREPQGNVTWLRWSGRAVLAMQFGDNGAGDRLNLSARCGLRSNFRQIGERSLRELVTITYMTAPKTGAIGYQ